MNKHRAVRLLFWIAAAYDGLLGLAFLFLPGRIFSAFDVPPPNHVGYVQFPAALLCVFAIMFAAVARRPVANRNLIPYGILLKVSYCGTIFTHWAAGGIPDMWKPFAVIDLAFAVLFLWAWLRLRKGRKTG